MIAHAGVEFIRCECGWEMKSPASFELKEHRVYEHMKLAHGLESEPDRDTTLFKFL